LFEFFAPFGDVFGVFDDFELTGLNFVVLFLSFSNFLQLFMFFFLLNFFDFVVFDLIAKLLHFSGTFLFFIPSHTKSLVSVVALRGTIGSNFPAPAALV
jgi:hypothetical protein